MFFGKFWYDPSNMNSDNTKNKNIDDNDPVEDVKKAFSFLTEHYIAGVKKFFAFLNTPLKKSLFILIFIFLVSLVILNLFDFNFFPTFLAYVFVIGICFRLVRLFKKAPDNSRQGKSSSGKTYEKYQTNHTSKEDSSEEDVKILYRKLVKKYHPDFAQSEEDKRFRTELTAKINRAYQDHDIKTLKLFDL